MNVDRIYEEFKSWLYSVIEDDPIPYEIKSLVFFINNNFEIGFSGFEEENVNIVDFGFYFPQDAEFFYCKELYMFFKKQNFNAENVLHFVKLLLKNLKKDAYFGKFIIFYGILFKNAKILN